MARGAGRIAALLVLVSLAGCARKAPGPDECHDLAVAWWRAERLRGLHRFQTPEDAILQRTTECITTPYDRELVECVLSGGAPPRCARAFESRHEPEAARELLPEPGTVPAPAPAE